MNKKVTGKCQLNVLTEVMLTDDCYCHLVVILEITFIFCLSLSRPRTLS